MSVRLTTNARCEQCKTREASIEASKGAQRLYFCGSQCAERYNGTSAGCWVDTYIAGAINDTIGAQQLLERQTSDWNKLRVVDAVFEDEEEDDDDDDETIGKLRILQTAQSKLVGKQYVIASMRDMIVTLYLDAICRNQPIEATRNYFTSEVRNFVEAQTMLVRRYQDMRLFLVTIGSRFYTTKRGTALVTLPKSVKILPRGQVCQANKGRQTVPAKFGEQLVGAIVYFNKQATKIRWGYNVVSEDQLNSHQKSVVADFQNLYRTTVRALLRLEPTASIAPSVRTEVALLLCEIFDLLWYDIPATETQEQEKTKDFFSRRYLDSQGQLPPPGRATTVAEATGTPTLAPDTDE